MEIPVDMLDKAISFITDKVIYNVDYKEILAVTDVSKLDKIDYHPINRCINDEFVLKSMTHQVYYSSRQNYSIDIIVAINKEDIRKCYLDQENFQDFRGIIIDGQHRVKTIRNILETDKSFTIRINMKIFILDGDEEILNLIRRLNTRNPFSIEHEKQSETNKKFRDEVVKVLGTMSKHRCIQKDLLSSPHLKDSQVIKKLDLLLDTSFNEKMKQIGSKYTPKYMEKLHTCPGFASKKLAFVINSTQWYQLVYENWLLEL